MIGLNSCYILSCFVSRTKTENYGKTCFKLSKNKLLLDKRKVVSIIRVWGKSGLGSKIFMERGNKEIQDFFKRIGTQTWRYVTIWGNLKDVSVNETIKCLLHIRNPTKWGRYFLLQVRVHSITSAKRQNDISILDI